MNRVYIKTIIVGFQVLQYNVPGGKKNRGLALVYAYRVLVAKDELTPENIRLSQIMGWCVEMVREDLILALRVSFAVIFCC